MKKVILFDPSYGTSNLGDFIINEAIMRQMKYVFSHNYLLRYSTHNPVLHTRQIFRKSLIGKNCNEAVLKFLGGTNLLKYNLLHFTPDWNINIISKTLYKDSISIGCGVANTNERFNWYTKHIYKTTLSNRFIHSARDEETKIFLENIGFKAINTGCPTLWDLNSNFCKTIPRNKSNDVVFTLTDYAMDEHKDQKLIDILLKNYKNVHFWIQGTEDLTYFKTLKNTKAIKLISPNLGSYDELLNQGDIDFVGTRLHAGIYAMQHKVRSIILVVDNRARDMQKTYNINAVERDDIDQLDEIINSEFATDIHIDQEKINLWKSQFKSYTQ